MIDNNLYKKHRAHKAWTVIVLTYVFFNVKYLFMKKNLYIPTLATIWLRVARHSVIATQKLHRIQHVKDDPN